MEKLEFPKLKKEQIECRVGNVSKDEKTGKVIGFSLLLYKTARVDDEILDSVVGAFNWQRKHYELKGNIYCSVGIYDKDRNIWVWKDDCGKESNTEAEKGESSDSFKRACFQWNIGRELYSAPFIWIKGYDPKTTRFEVSKIEISDERVITKLEIVESKTKTVVFTTEKKEPVKKVGLSEEVKKLVQQYEIRLDRVAKYNSTTIENLTDEQVLESINTKKKYLEGAKND